MRRRREQISYRIDIDNSYRFIRPEISVTPVRAFGTRFQTAHARPTNNETRAKSNRNKYGSAGRQRCAGIYVVEVQVASIVRVYRSQQFVHERITDAQASGEEYKPRSPTEQGTHTFRLNEPVGKGDSERVHPRSAYARQYGLNARLQPNRQLTVRNVLKL